LAEERGYLPPSVPILKNVAAKSGHHACSRDRALTIDGVPAGRALERDGIGQPLEHWAHCRSLDDDEVFLLGSSNPASFDSRYFGPVNVSSIAGRSIPLWTW
jgi:type IV secretory pathway protease TraF